MKTVTPKRNKNLANLNRGHFERVMEDIPVSDVFSHIVNTVTLANGKRHTADEELESDSVVPFPLDLPVARKRKASPVPDATIVKRVKLDSAELPSTESGGRYPYPISPPALVAEEEKEPRTFPN
ncbi:hypothetical protein DFH09DRAFT_1301706 [Mycena vulgaris]|nr:hypothetical protein DFH09DRAFT_1301706 [Mycena vulgaris]